MSESRITTVLFDLDGTLLPMDQELFVKDYFSRLARHLAPYGYEPKKLVESIWAGTKEMVTNNGDCLNEERFANAFCRIYGEEASAHFPIFDAFYLTEFDKVRTSCGYNPEAAQILSLCRQKGLTTVLATNPIFPPRATECRIRWAGLKQEDFVLITNYSNSRHCKPNLDYYREILSQLSLSPEECVMVGNDVDEDMIAAQLGMRVFLLTDCLINRRNAEISAYPNGDFTALADFLRELP